MDGKEIRKGLISPFSNSSYFKTKYSLLSIMSGDYEAIIFIREGTRWEGRVLFQVESQGIFLATLPAFCCSAH